MNGFTRYGIGVLATAAAVCALSAAPAVANHPVTDATWADDLEQGIPNPFERAASPAPARAVQMARAATGPERRAVLMCRYTDSPNPSTKTKAHFEGMFGQLAAYYDEASYGTLDFTYTVQDWQSLGKARAEYGTVPGDSVGTNLTALITDCANAHDSNVDFTQFDAIDVVLDERAGFGYAGVGGVDCGPDLDGVFKCWPATWIPADEASAEPGANGMALWAHEVGHSLNLPHTVREGGTQWLDPMGFPCGGSTAGGAEDPAYGCRPVHYLAAHKDKDFLGWIDKDRRVTVKPGKKRTVELERLALPADSGRALIARMPIRSENGDCPPGYDPSTNCKPYYTAEVRMGAPGSVFESPAQLGDGQGVVISRVDIGCEVGTAPCEFDYVPVQVQSKGGPDEPSSSMWQPGETFKGEGVKVKVTQALSTGYKVKIVNGS